MSADSSWLYWPWNSIDEWKQAPVNAVKSLYNGVVDTYNSAVDSWNGFKNSITGAYDNLYGTINDAVKNTADFLSNSDNVETLKDFGSDVLNIFTNKDNPGSVGSGSAAKKSLNYLNADLAAYYGMNSETAYQEALSNTAYQRKVADLKAAGLNPVLGLDGSGASVFSGTSMTSSGTGSGSSNAAKTLSDFLPVIGSLVSLGVGIAFENPYLVSTGSYRLGQTAKGLFK